MKQLFSAVHRHSQHLVGSSAQAALKQQSSSLLPFASVKTFAGDNKKPADDKKKATPAATAVAQKKPEFAVEVAMNLETPFSQRVSGEISQVEKEIYHSHLNPEANARVVEEEKQYMASLSEKERHFLQANRILGVKNLDEYVVDKNTWWGRIQTMSEEDMDNLPTEVLKKYSSFVIRGEEMQQEMQLNENQSNEERWRFVRQNKALTTKPEIEAQELEKDLARADTDYDRLYNYAKEGYMSRQPRFNLSKHSYNHEQFKRYTNMYEQAWRKDREQLSKFYKMLNYVKANPDSKDTAAVNFRKKYFVDLIEVPEEFKHETTDHLDKVLNRDIRARRTSLKAKARIDMSRYDAWRNYDRQIMIADPRQRCIRRIAIAPAALVKAFGNPGISNLGFPVSGIYHFEDSNLDAYTLHDYKQTQLYHGLNREDEYYDKQLKKPPHKRDKRWPTIEEFWDSTEPVHFRLHCTHLADWVKFRIWLRRTLQEAEGKAVGFDEECLAKYGDAFDICKGDYSKRGQVNHDHIAVYKYDFTMHMTPDELKKLPQDQFPEPLVPPKAFDFSRAERIVMTREELMRREQEIQEQMKRAE